MACGRVLGFFGFGVSFGVLGRFALVLYFIFTAVGRGLEYGKVVCGVLEVCCVPLPFDVWVGVV